MVRAYRLETMANCGKLAEVAAILPVWQQGLGEVQRQTIRRLRTGDHKLGWTDTKALTGPLSQRQWKSVTNQVNANLKSWRGSAKIEFRRYVTDSSLDAERKRALYQINIRGAWWSRDGVLNQQGLVVSHEDLRLARHIIRRVVARDCRFPELRHVRTMSMDGPIAQVERGRNSQDLWVRISTLQRGKPVCVPLRAHAYFEADPGTLSNFCQVNVGVDGIPSFTLVKHKPVAPARAEGRVLSLDWGLTNLFTTSEGDLLGRRLYPWLLAVDTQLIGITRQLQKNGVKPRDSRRYQRLQTRIREHVRNEVGRVLNRLAADGELSELVVENLDFRGRGLSPRLRRIVSRAGRSVVAAKLQSLREAQGIAITHGNPAYTSQECCGCGYVHASNRRSQSRFVCGFCGRTLNADVSAARILVARRSRKDEFAYASKQQVKAALDNTFSQRWGIAAAEVGLRCRQRRCSTAAGASVARLNSV
jgi:putative transposase